ncbi:MAG: replication factor C large subunit [Candidatus Micrarchaeota archaeon]|nr:replication factor C large subunit [Candidatus Micrarchaeota archaeon]
MQPEYSDNIYMPESLDKIVGNPGVVNRLRLFASDSDKGVARTPLMLHGPSGVGKSVSAHLLAGERGWNVVELNASDYRDSETIERRLMSAASSRSIFGKRNLILLDEVDELFRDDRGAGAAIGAVISSAKNPIILIANDAWDQRISFLRGKTEMIEFRKLNRDDLVRVLNDFCASKSYKAKKEDIEMFAAMANGDARSAINDLYAAMGSEGDVSDAMGIRDRKIDVFSMLDKVFMANTMAASLRAVSNSDLTNDMLIKWLEENIPNRYADAGDIARAFGALAESSAYATKAVRSQYYTYWRYMKVLMSAGISLSKASSQGTSRRYAFPKIIKELSASKSERRKADAIAESLQSRLHSSTKRIVKGEMVIISQMIKKSVQEGADAASISEGLVRSYGLAEDDAAYLVKKVGI